MRWDSQLIDRPGDQEALPLASLEGGRGAVVRQFKTPEFAGMKFYETQAKSIINHVSGDRFGFNWTINPYRGCSHGCTYCFARPTHTYLEFNAGNDFDTKIVVKVNAVELLHKELRRKGWPGDMIAMGTNTDPYQRAEGHYKLMRGILHELNQFRNPYSILTKGTLIQRDIDLLREGVEVTDVSTCFSVGTVDENVWKLTEPGAPHPMKRLETVRKLNDAGIPCGVLMGPVIPLISDSPEQLEATVRAAAQAGAKFVTPIVLHLRPGVKEEFLGWLDKAFPELLKPYGALYTKSTPPKPVSAQISSAVASYRAKYNVKSRIPPQPKPLSNKKPEVVEVQEQLSLEVGGAEPRRAPRWVRDSLTA